MNEHAERRATILSLRSMSFTTGLVCLLLARARYRQRVAVVGLRLCRHCARLPAARPRCTPWRYQQFLPLPQMGGSNRRRLASPPF
jgi:hypothetical protein